MLRISVLLAAGFLMMSFPGWSANVEFKSVTMQFPQDKAAFNREEALKTIQEVRTALISDFDVRRCGKITFPDIQKTTCTTDFKCTFEYSSAKCKVMNTFETKADLRQCSPRGAPPMKGFKLMPPADRFFYGCFPDLSPTPKAPQLPAPASAT